MSVIYFDTKANYSNNIIYKIFYNKNPELFAIGSTCNGEMERMRGHIKDYFSGKYSKNHKLYNAFQQYGHENFTIEKIENYPCKNYLDARKRERYWQDKLNATLNTIKAYSSKEEQYDEFKKLMATKVECKDCGIITSKSGISAHKISKNHKHMTNVKQMIKENKYEKFDNNKLLPSGKVVCCCMLEFSSYRAHEKHFKGSKHKQFMEIINKSLINNDRIKNESQIDECKNEFTCDCGFKTSKNKQSKHIESITHKNLLKIKNMILNENNGIKMDIPTNKYKCDCYCIISHLTTQNHLNSNKHKVYLDAVKNIKLLTTTKY